MSHHQIQEKQNLHHHNDSQSSSASCQHTCCTITPTNPSVMQNLDDMDFEKGLWQAAIDDNVQRITYLINRKIPVDLPDSYG